MRSIRLLTTAEVAERLGVKPALLRTWRHRGLGPKWDKLATIAVYREDDVAKWEAQREASA